MKHVSRFIASLIVSLIASVFATPVANATALVIPKECASNPYLRTDYLNAANTLEWTQAQLVRLKSQGVDMVHLPKWTKLSMKSAEVKKVYEALQLGAPSTDLDESLRIHLSKAATSPLSVQGWSTHQTRVASKLGSFGDTNDGEQLAREIQAMIYEVSRQKLVEIREKSLVACKTARRDGLDPQKPTK